MTTQRYLLWEVDGAYKFRLGKEIFATNVSNKTKRELLTLFNRWADEALTMKEQRDG